MDGRDPPPQLSLSRGDARLIGLAAQGFGGRRSLAVSPWPVVQATIARLGLLQLDSVNALVRAHYLPAFARVGAYRREQLDRHAFAYSGRRYFEYWAHEASLLPLAMQPLFRWRMRRAEHLEQGIYRGLAEFVRNNRVYVEAVRNEIAAHGAMAASELDDPGQRGGPWWGWHKGKAALEYLFWAGIVTAAGRRNFERLYDLTERAIPADILALPTPSDADAIRSLMRHAAGALGVATAIDLRDYFRLPVAEAHQAVVDLVEEGTLQPVTVEGWRQPAYLVPGTPQPARSGASALVSPFDPLIWHRPRTERLFEMDFRLEFYVPPQKRQFGYLVLPYLFRGRFVARVDLRAERRNGRLAVHAAFFEGKAISEPALAGLAEELRHLAAWLELDTVWIGEGGDLSARLRRHFE